MLVELAQQIFQKTHKFNMLLLHQILKFQEMCQLVLSSQILCQKDLDNAIQEAGKAIQLSLRFYHFSVKVN